MKNITFQFGAISQSISTDATTVAGVYNEVCNLFQIPTDYTVRVNGGSADRNTAVHGGDTISFSKATGTKG